MNKIPLLLIATFVSVSLHAQFGVGDLINKKMAASQEKKFNEERAQLVAKGPSYAFRGTDAIPTEFHKNQIGKAVFSKEKIDASVSSDAKLTNTFNFGDPIEVRYFWGASLRHYHIYKKNDNEPTENVSPNSTICYWVDIIIDGEKQKFSMPGLSLVKGDNIEATSLGRTIYGSGNNVSTYFVDKMNSLPDGNHIVRLEMWAGDRDAWDVRGKSLTPICTGEFTIVKNPETKLKYGKSFNTVGRAKSDPELEAKMLKKINAFVINLDDQKDEVYTKCKIQQEDWIIVRADYTNEILGRYHSVIAYYKNGNGDCGYREYRIAQQWDGTGYQNSVYLIRDDYGEYVGMKNERIDCDQ